jgi:deoxyribose-phosphate aldolase
MMNQSNDLSPQKLAGFIDHTLLRPDATEAEIKKVCLEAIEHGFKTVCVELKWLPTAVEHLKGTGVLPIAVVCFPEGTAPTQEKVESTLAAVRAGAQEIDMVLNRIWLKEKKYDLVLKDIQEVKKAAGKAKLKVILETSELNQQEKAIACALAKLAGADYVKTSTGFSKSGATVEDVRLMSEIVGSEMGVKASGGVRSYEDAVKMIVAGATRLGTSASVAIVQGAKAKSEGY